MGSWNGLGFFYRDHIGLGSQEGKSLSKGIFQGDFAACSLHPSWRWLFQSELVSTCPTLKLPPQVLHPLGFSWKGIKTQQDKLQLSLRPKNQTSWGLFLYFGSFVNRSKAHPDHAGARPGRARKPFQGDDSLQESPHVSGVFCFPKRPKLLPCFPVRDNLFPNSAQKTGKVFPPPASCWECLQLLPGAAAGAGQLPARQDFS